MKTLLSVLTILILTALAVVTLSAQNREITFILLRHAERYPSTKQNNSDPELTPEGLQRAERLVETVRKYKPEQIFSTNLKRTRATATPLAEKLNDKYRMQIQIYSFDDIEGFAEKLLKLDARTVVVVGHNNTTPALANLLIKQEKYKQLDESVYNKIWIIKVKKGKAKDQVIEY